MAKNILIIGNGFDLYHGLPTRYTDFLTFTKYFDDFEKLYNIGAYEKEADDKNQLEIRLGPHGELLNESMDDFARYDGRACI